MFTTCLPLFTCFVTLIFSSSMILSNAADTISPAQSIRDGETLVSASQRFQLGFFTPGKSNKRYLGIWYEFSPSTVVWVANRRNPITDGQGVLVMSDYGELVLLSNNKNIIWSTNSSKVPRNPVAQLLDSGNFVLRDTSSDSYVWQSFDYPSDTLLSGTKLGWNLRTGFERYLTPWKSDEDPYPGDFSLRLDIQGIPQLLIAIGSKKLARSGPWNGQQFVGLPVLNKVAFKRMLVRNQDELFVTYELANNTVITRLLFDQSGILQRFVWNWNSKEWIMLYHWPNDACDNYAECGPNQICRNSKAPICECLKGFVPEVEDIWNTSSKCVEKLPAECLSGERFLRLSRTKVPDGYWSNTSMNLKECEAKCYKNCSCKAYANSDVREGGTGCLMWFGELIDIRECSAGFSWGQDFYLRVPASELESANYLNDKKRIMIIVMVATIAGIFSLGLALYKLKVWKKTKNRGLENREDEAEVSLVDLCIIVAATNNFSQANMIGKGGFGSVYKGTLSTKQEIAVKRLSKNSGQGVEEFKNEIVLIGKLQHRNLVGLLGCCIHGDERMLVYEYMPNKSLDYFIFDCERSKLLVWRKRFDIIIGIARGLLYLHQDSKLQVIHRDLKTSNILLDNDFNPKISDFGLARIFNSDEKERNTNRVAGTYGYMSPEYAVDGTFSLKSDVFSFGVLLLEVVSGKKNRGFFHPNNDRSLLGHAWVQWNNERALELVDTCLEGSFIESQVLRCIQVGLLCVQTFPEDRPDMSSVVFMLANERLSLSQPKEPGFFMERAFNSGSTLSKGKSQTTNAMSISTLDGR